MLSFGRFPLSSFLFNRCFSVFWYCFSLRLELFFRLGLLGLIMKRNTLIRALKGGGAFLFSFARGFSFLLLPGMRKENPWVLLPRAIAATGTAGGKEEKNELSETVITQWFSRHNSVIELEIRNGIYGCLNPSLQCDDEAWTISSLSSVSWMCF